MFELKNPGYTELFGYFGAWITKFQINGRDYGGSDNLTNDARINQLNELCVVKDKRILELGPLEGAHSLMLSRLGARQVVAVEGRVKNFVKCCCIKNLFDLTNVQFVLSNVENLKPEGYGTFDLIVAIGVLYHLRNPAQVLTQLSAMTERIFIWTHFSDAKYPSGPIEMLQYDGKSYAGKLYHEVGLKDPLSGLDSYSFWPFEEDLHRMLQDAGFSTRQILNKGSMYVHEAKHCTLFCSKNHLTL
jgi:SAM-dependent methyltransferase